MIDPRQFYSASDEATKHEHDTTWNRIAAQTIPSSRHQFFSLERRSFVFGMAAAVVIMFASVGIYTTVHSAIEAAQPPAIQIDRAYESAIDGFQRVAARYGAPSQESAETPDVVKMRQEQLHVLESAIAALRTEMSTRDLSPLLRANLRDLYAKKLSLLQTMVEQGDIEL